MIGVKDLSQAYLRAVNISQKNCPKKSSQKQHKKKLNKIRKPKNENQRTEKLHESDYKNYLSQQFNI